MFDRFPMVRSAVAAFLICLVYQCIALDAGNISAQDRYALTIGVDRYNGDFRPLNFAGRDAQGVGLALERLGYNVVTMGHHQARGDLNPSNPDKILSKIRELADSGREGDTLVLFMSGHGCQFPDDSETYFCPSDADLKNKESLIPISEVMSLLEKSAAKQCLVLLDACQEEILSLRNAKGGVRRVQIPNLVDTEKLIPQSLAVFFSCSPKQRSFEDPDLPNVLDVDGPRGQGIFSHFVIQYLSGLAPAENYPRSGEMEITSMENFVRIATEKHSQSKGPRQKPRLKCDGVFSIGHRPKVPALEQGGVNVAGVDKMSPSNSLDANEIANKINKDFRNYLYDHPALLTADASAEIVYIPEKKAWMMVAVGSSKLSVQEPKLACKLKALAALTAAKEGINIEETSKLTSAGAVQEILSKLNGKTLGLPVVGEWISADGKSISILYGQILETSK